MLVIGDSSGTLVSQWLSPCPGLSFIGCRQISLKSNLEPYLARDWTLEGVFATMYGDIVCRIDSPEDDHLARVTTNGQVVWFITRECCVVAIRYVSHRLFAECLHSTA